MRALFGLPARSISTVLSISLLASCGDTSEPSVAFTVSGSVLNNTQAAIPAAARVLVAWVVSSGSPDYTYVFGEGSINASAGTFEVQFTDPPPRAALNSGNLGVGIVVLTTNASIGQGDDLEDFPLADLIGAAPRHAVIYIDGDPQNVTFREWAHDFESSFNAGVGIKVPGSFDEFVPLSPSSIVLIVDDLQNLEFVNWT